MIEENQGDKKENNHNSNNNHSNHNSNHNHSNHNHNHSGNNNNPNTQKNHNNHNHPNHNHNNHPAKHNNHNHNHNQGKHNHPQHNHPIHNHAKKNNSDSIQLNIGPIAQKIKKEISGNHWAMATIVLAIILLFIVFSPSKTTTGGVIGEAKAGEIVLNFAQAQGLEATLIDTKFENGLYEVTVTIQDQDVPVYLTSDGKNLVPSVIPIEAALAQGQQANPAAQPRPTEIPKSGKPKIELFVMTHCPYGTQAEKGFLPVMEILETKDLADVDIKFVHYFLHEPENDETPIQVCIREEQSDKFITYLKKFLEEGDSAASMVEAGVDPSKVQECIDSGRAAEYYEQDSKESQAYGVKGSPTLIINGVESNIGRSEAAYLSGICDTFDNAPEICSLSLETKNPAPGFGYGGSSAAATAACVV